MERLKIPGLGMRTIKTAIAVSLCLAVALLLQLWEPLRRLYPSLTPIYACTAAIICMQDTVNASLRHGMLRLLGTGIGGAVGILFLYLNQNDWIRVLLAFAGIALCIFLCNILHIRQASAISCVVFSIVLLARSGMNPYTYSIIRIVETAAGILIAVGVNKLIPVNPAARAEDEANESGFRGM